MKTIPCLPAIVAALILSPGLSLAHPGHSMSHADTMHLLTTPYHLVVLSIIGVGLLLGGTFVQRRLPRSVIRGCGALTLAGAAVIWGMGA